MNKRSRDKEYDAEYNAKMKEQLGMEYGHAHQKLERMVFWKCVQDLNRNTCWHCKQPIESSEDMSIEHMVPWRGTNQRESRPELFWDLNNLAFSHTWCNSGGSTRGSGELGYFGVDSYCDKRNGKLYKKIRARHTIGKKTLTMGYFDDLLSAAIAADIGVMRIRKGCGPLNFEFLREDYKDYLIMNFDDDANIFYKRGPIKTIVEHFLPRVRMAEVVKEELGPIFVDDVDEQTKRDILLGEAEKPQDLDEGTYPHPIW